MTRAIPVDVGPVEPDGEHVFAADGPRDRLARLLYGAVGAGAIIFGGLSMQPFLAQVDIPSLVWSWTAWLMVFLLPVLPASLSRRAPLSILRGLARVHGAVFVIILVGWLVLGAHALPVGLGIPWVLSFTGVPCVAVAVSERATIAWAFVVVACTLSGVVRAVTTPGERPALVGLQDGLYSLLLISVFVGFTLALRRSASRVEAATRLSRAADARVAACTARTLERQMIDDLVHDSVISTLLVAGLGRADNAVISRQAATTLEKLDFLSMPTEFEVVARSLVWARLEALTSDLAPAAILRAELHLDRMIPVRVGDAVVGAVGEALRNSVASAAIGHRHPVTRRVTVRPSGGGIQVLVSDDGAGFEPSLVPAERLGIAQSIVGRMKRVPGGAAVVRSRPGHGTEVLITWIPPAAITGVPSVAPRRAVADGVASAQERDIPAVASREGKPQRPDNAPRLMSLTGTVAPSIGLARGILGLFIGVHVLLAVAEWEHVGRFPVGPAVDVLALLAVSAAGLWSILPARDPFPRSRTLGILGLCGVAGGLMFLHVSPLDERPFAQWHLGAVTLVLVVLVARGRLGWVWVGYAALAVSTVAWGLAYGLSIADGVGLVIRHAGTLLVGTLFAVGLRRSGRSLNVLILDGSQRAAGKAASDAVAKERAVQLARFNALARPALEGLVEPHELSRAEQAECLLVEGSLRDAIRARSLFIEPIVSATRAARSRGVEVTLLDDSGDFQPADVSVLARLVCDELDALNFGRFTARILPSGRVDLATVVVEAVEHRMLVVARDGTARDA
ncbi:sensor histidine kinase [Cryobacterium psychrophilum]|uniref:Histidine kinase/HSP90-like ATPase domain-containing protein n=1 Tax=Cryobacterium psychrophilum TaxID=41988 RepID=A0A4Y8KSF6_9MICO|nr:hypothetical protein [Cryobacterium psychrophilum]TDW30567.1 signal transduction histidine kinase [Cryobacterium psychrophilum]TFD80216.1 hypothetical protein E3T53_05770 [Cryobacterium psychrophilum]